MNEITIKLNQQEFTGGDTVADEVMVRLDQDTPLRGIRRLTRNSPARPLCTCGRARKQFAIQGNSESTCITASSRNS
jgi:hypothetical protein